MRVEDPWKTSFPGICRAYQIDLCAHAFGPVKTAESDDLVFGRSCQSFLTRSRHSTVWRGLNLAGDVAALLRQAAKAVRIAPHLIDVEVALIVQRA